MPEKVRASPKEFMQKELIKTCILLDMYLTWAIAPSVQITRWFPRYENMLWHDQCHEAVLHRDLY